MWVSHDMLPVCRTRGGRQSLAAPRGGQANRNTSSESALENGSSEERGRKGTVDPAKRRKCHALAV